MAGKPSKVGGTVASVFGWLILALGASFALGVGLLFAAFHLYAVALALALPMILFSSTIGALLVRRGGSLNRAGAALERATHDQALLALAAHKGSVHAIDAARALGVSVEQADAMLTDLAKRAPEALAVDIEDSGEVAYRFVDSRIRVEGGPRVDVLEGEDGEPAGAVAELAEEPEPQGAMARTRTVPRT
jgi:hypothetical protein